MVCTTIATITPARLTALTNLIYPANVIVLIILLPPSEEGEISHSLSALLPNRFRIIGRICPVLNYGVTVQVPSAANTPVPLGPPLLVDTTVTTHVPAALSTAEVT